MSILIKAFTPTYQKIRFQDKETAAKGLALLLRSGGGEAFGSNVYGLSSPRQLDLLKESGLLFEIVKEKGEK